MDGDIEVCDMCVTMCIKQDIVWFKVTMIPVNDEKYIVSKKKKNTDGWCAVCANKLEPKSTLQPKTGSHSRPGTLYFPNELGTIYESETQ